MEIATNLSPARPGKQHKTQCALTPLPGSTGPRLRRGHLPAQALLAPFSRGLWAPEERKTGPGSGGLSSQLSLESPEPRAHAAVLLSLQASVFSWD